MCIVVCVCVCVCAEGTLYGPLHSEVAVEGYEKAISEIKAQVCAYIQFIS